MTVLLIGILVCAVISDLRTYKIPNYFILFSYVLGIIGVCLTKGFSAIPYAILQSLIICFSFYLLYLVHAIGAGDVKLFSVIAVFEGAKASYKILIASLFVGAILGLFKVVVKFFKKKIKEKGGGIYKKLQKSNTCGTQSYINRIRFWLLGRLKTNRMHIHFSIPILIAALSFKGGIF